MIGVCNVRVAEISPPYQVSLCPASAASLSFLHRCREHPNYHIKLDIGLRYLFGLI